MEEWKAVLGYEGRYEVSNLGRVRSLPNSRRKTTLLMEQSISADGYLVVNLTRSENGAHRQRVEKVHRLVLLSFVGEWPNKPFALHEDGDRTNALLSNLYWGTQAQNMADRRRHGRGNIGERNPMVKLTRSQAQSIKARLTNRKRGDVANVARELGLNYRTVLSIANGSNWSEA